MPKETIEVNYRNRNNGLGARSEGDYLPMPPKSDYFPLAHKNLPQLNVNGCDHVLGFFVPSDEQLHKVSMSNYHEYINESLDYNTYDENTYKDMDYACERCPKCGKMNPWSKLKKVVANIVNPNADAK